MVSNGPKCSDAATWWKAQSSVQRLVLRGCVFAGGGLTNLFPPSFPRLKSSVTELPFNRFLGLEVATDPAQILRLPGGPQYLNHLETVHASAQLALAEATSGEFLLRGVGSIAGLVPVVRRLESKFRKPAHGALVSTVTTSPEVLEKVRADLEARGRATVTVEVELYDESDAHTLSATVEWFITRLSPSHEPV